MKLKPKDIKRYNKIAAAGKKPIMVRVNQNWYTWLEGDPKYGVFLTTQSGRDIEFGWKQIDDIQEGVMKLTKSKLKEMVKEELLSEAMTEINTKRDLQRALKSAFNEIFKGKTPKELVRGDTGEMLLTTEIDGRGARVEIVPSVIADAVRELK